MRLSNAGKAFIKRWEGVRLEIYLCSAKKPTIGVGHVCSAQEQELFKDGITQEQADELFLKDVAKFETAVNQMVRVPLTQSQFDALVSFAFNLGINALRRSTLMQKLNARYYQTAADEFSKWVNVTVNGKLKKVAGLVSRRAEERAMFLKKPPAPDPMKDVINHVKPKPQQETISQ